MTLAFRNPIIPGFNPDPTIQRVGDDYFLLTSTFEWFPGSPIYHSRDLIKWELIGHVYTRPSQLNMRGTAPSGGLFANTLRYHEQTKTFYAITTWFDVISPPDNVTRTPRSMYVHTTNIWDDSTWSDPIYVDQPGFDPDLFFDDDGTVYFTSTMGAGAQYPDSGYFAIWLTELDLATGDSLTDSSVFHISTLPLDTPRLAEGSHIFKKDGYYYCMTAEAGTGVQHREMIMRSRSMKTPGLEWEQNPNNPILFNGRDLSQPILATGHGDFVQTPTGDWYIVFLGIRPQNPTNASGSNQLGRETFLAPVTWEDGWPVVNHNQSITSEMPGLYDLARPKVWRDDFTDGTFIDKGYYTQRTPYKAFHSLTARGGHLRLRGNAYTLSDRETPAAFFRKQTDLATVFSTALDFAPASALHEAGATVFLDINFHDEIAVTLHPNDTARRTVVARTRTGMDAVLSETYYDVPAEGTVRLFIKAERSKYSLGYAVGDAGPSYVAVLDARWLQTALPGWQTFTGAHFGVYATGNTLPMRVPADFDYVQTELIADVS